MFKSNFRGDRGGSRGGGGFKGGRKFGGGGGGFGGGDRSDRPLFDATCSECGSDCQVPFRPSPGKSVKCRNCFKKDESGFGGPRPERSFRDAPRGATPPDTGKLLAQLTRIEEKLDVLIEALMDVGDEDGAEIDEDEKK